MSEISYTVGRIALVWISYFDSYTATVCGRIRELPGRQAGLSHRAAWSVSRDPPATELSDFGSYFRGGNTSF